MLILTKIKRKTKMIKCKDTKLVRDAQDAARYRWLKKQAFVVDEDGGWASHFQFPCIDCHNDSPNKAYQLKRRTLDQAIDAEITKK